MKRGKAQNTVNTIQIAKLWNTYCEICSSVGINFLGKRHLREALNLWIPKYLTQVCIRLKDLLTSKFMI